MEQGLKAKAQSHDGKAEGDDGFQDPGRNTGKGIAAIFHLTNDKQVGMPGDDAGDGPCKGQGQGMADYLKFRGQQAGQYIDTNMFVDACGSHGAKQSYPQHHDAQHGIEPDYAGVKEIAQYDLAGSENDHRNEHQHHNGIFQAI